MLSFFDAVKVAWARKFDVQGRACRSEFWFTFLALFIISFLNAFIMRFGAIGAIIGMVIQIGVLWTFFTTAIRRLHDRGLSGAWCLLVVIPTVGIIILLILCALPGSPDFNRFGAEPISSGLYQQILGGNSYQQNNYNYSQNQTQQPHHQDQGELFPDDDFSKKLRAHVNRNDDNNQNS